jgi:hypothetical protein
MRKTARPVVWEGAEAQSSALDPIGAVIGSWVVYGARYGRGWIVAGAGAVKRIVSLYIKPSSLE